MGWRNKSLAESKGDLGIYYYAGVEIALTAISILCLWQGKFELAVLIGILIEVRYLNVKG